MSLSAIANGSRYCYSGSMSSRGSAAPLKLIDVFCGCGGFSLGAHQAGFDVAAAYDMDPNLTHSYRHNFPSTRLHLLDVADLDGEALVASAGGHIDGIFGGPPCQGFSDIGHREPDDPRRQLLGHFFRLVRQVEPSFFIMENVRGLAYSDARGVLDEALGLVSDRYAVLGPHIWEASQFGAATRRRRLFVIGVHKDRADALTMEEVAVRKAAPTTVRAAIADLDDAVRLDDENGYDIWRLGRPGRPSDYSRSLRAADGRFTGHRLTIHRPDVVARFASLAPGQIDPIGRHPKLSWFGQCPTLRAGTGVERGSYQSVRPIHPSEPRVITVREAARLQGFPDAHRFHPAIWHSFRMIGNSVSPVIAREIFTAVAAKFGSPTPLALAAE